MITRTLTQRKPDGIERIGLDENEVTVYGVTYIIPGNEKDAWEWYEARKLAGPDEYADRDITAIPADYWRNPPSTWLTTLTQDEVDERQRQWDATNPDDDYGVA